MADDTTAESVDVAYALVQINEPENEHLEKKLLTVPTRYIMMNAGEFFVRYAFKV